MRGTSASKENPRVCGDACQSPSDEPVAALPWRGLRGGRFAEGGSDRARRRHSHLLGGGRRPRTAASPSAASLRRPAGNSTCLARVSNSRTRPAEAGTQQTRAGASDVTPGTRSRQSGTTRPQPGGGSADSAARTLPRGARSGDSLARPV